MVADFRAIYGVSVWDVSVAEAWDLMTMLLRDPSSRLHASIAGWEHPVSREWLVLADVFDVQLAAISGKRKRKPYPRPFDQGTKTRIGGTKKVRRSAEQVRALLDRPRIPRPELGETP